MKALRLRFSGPKRELAFRRAGSSTERDKRMAISVERSSGNCRTVRKTYPHFLPTVWEELVLYAFMVALSMVASVSQ